MFTKKKMVKVGVAVTIDNRMEVAVVDSETKKVTDYRQVEMMYNFQTKELEDYEQFTTTLQNLLSEMGLNPKNVNLTLTIPNIHFATTQLPANVEGDVAVNTALAAIAQESYLFKRREPVTAHKLYTGNNKDENFVVFSAIQENVIEQLRDALISIGLETFSINNPYGSVINGLEYVGKINKQINSGEIWNFVQITNNGFTLFSMLNSKIREINDMPLPLKTFAPEEIYESVALSLQNNLSIYPAASLFVLSRTDLLSAQMLLQRMDLHCEVDFLENNRYQEEPYIQIDEKVDLDLAKIISAEVIGSAISDKNSPLTLSYLTKKNQEDTVLGYINFRGKNVPVNDSFLTMALISISIAIFALGTLIFVITSGINSQLEASIKKLDAEKSRLKDEILKAKGETGGNVDTIIADISKYNKSSVEYFNAISTEIPRDLWLTYFYTDSSGAIGIKGDTADVGSIYDFFQGVKKSVKNSNIILSKLDYNDIDALLIPDGHGNKTLAFEITNNAYADSIKMMASQVAEGENTEGEAKDKSETTPSGNSSSEDEGLPEPPSFEPPATN